MHHDFNLRRQLEFFVPGQVFSAQDFKPLANRGATDMALTRLVRRARARRLTRGLYCYDITGYEMPAPWVVAQAKARSNGINFHHCKAAYAAVPYTDFKGRTMMTAVRVNTDNVRVFYSSQGSAKFVYLDQYILIKRISPRRMLLLQQIAGDFLFSMLQLGRAFHQQHPYFLTGAINGLERHVRVSLKHCLRYLPGWMCARLQEHACA